MTLTPTELRGFIETNLSDAQLQILLDAAYADIDRVAGDASNVSLQRGKMGPLLMLPMQAASITKVVENDIELAADDYQLVDPPGQRVRRLDTGTNPRTFWGSTEITYATGISDAEKDRVAIALVKLDEGYNPGLTGQSIQTWSEQYKQNAGDYGTERNDVLATLGGQSASPMLR